MHVGATQNVRQCALGKVAAGAGIAWLWSAVCLATLRAAPRMGHNSFALAGQPAMWLPSQQHSHASLQAFHAKRAVKLAASGLLKPRCYRSAQPAACTWLVSGMAGYLTRPLWALLGI